MLVIQMFSSRRVTRTRIPLLLLLLLLPLFMMLLFRLVVVLLVMFVWEASDLFLFAALNMPLQGTVVLVLLAAVHALELLDASMYGHVTT